MSSIRRAGSLKSTKMSRQDSESENDVDSERLLSQSRDTVTDIGQTMLLQPYMKLFYYYICKCSYWGNGQSRIHYFERH